MKTKLKRKWIAALRSGNFKQGVGQLRNEDNECCCLGVLADVSGCKWHKQFWPTKTKNFLGWGIATKPIYRYQLPAHILRKVGLDKFNQNFLMNLNDGQRKNFSYIAKWIEKNL